MYQRRYDKVYLMLRQETAGYGRNGRTPWGSCVLEIKNGKGKLTISVQGLYELSGSIYRVYALAAKKTECVGILCGELPLGKQGQGELTWAFLPDDLGEGYIVEDLFAVVVTTEAGGRMAAPLTAYFGQKRAWRDAFCPMEAAKDLRAAETAVIQPPSTELSRVCERNNRMPIQEMLEPKREEENPQQEIPQHVFHTVAPSDQMSEKTMEAEPSYHGSFRGLLRKFRQEMEELEEMGILTAEESARILGKQPAEQPEQERAEEATRDRANALQNRTPAEKAEQRVRSDTTEQQSTAPEVEAQADANATKERQMPVGRSAETEGRERVFFANNQILYPFGTQEAWYGIRLEELLFFPETPLQWQKDFFFLLPYRRYGHLILRKTQDGYLFGLPDRYQAENRRRAEMLGFREFRHIEGEEDFGYWIGAIGG